MASLSYKTIMWILPDAIFLIVVLVSIAGVITSFAVTKVDVKDGEANIAIHRLYFSPNSFSEYDEKIGRFYHGRIDATKINDETVESALSYGNVVMAARFNFESPLEFTGTGVTEKTASAYINREKYQTEWIVFAMLAEEGVRGKTVNSYREYRYVSSKGRSLPLGTVVLMPK